MCHCSECMDFNYALIDCVHVYGLLLGFYPRGASSARVIVIIVCLCVCVSHAGIVLKLLNVKSRKQHHIIAQGV